MGRSHTAVLTQHGTVFTFGNNSFGQCGRNYKPPKEKGATRNFSSRSIYLWGIRAGPADPATTRSVFSFVNTPTNALTAEVHHLYTCSCRCMMLLPGLPTSVVRIFLRTSTKISIFRRTNPNVLLMPLYLCRQMRANGVTCVYINVCFVHKCMYMYPYTFAKGLEVLQWHKASFLMVSLQPPCMYNL